MPITPPVHMSADGLSFVIHGVMIVMAGFMFAKSGSPSGWAKWMGIIAILISSFVGSWGM